MIGSLLKQLFSALGRFIGYHILRWFRRRQEPARSEPAERKGDTLEQARIDPYYLQRVDWPCHRAPAPPEELTSNALYQLWAAIPGGMKWTHYFAAYEAVFGPRRAEPLRILEIGVHEGSSLQMWRRYFTDPRTSIVGIDILPDCRRFDAPADGIHVRIGSQADGAFLSEVANEFGPFDLIIDDGSHRSSHMIASFNHLFARGLDDHGIYFVEDLHTNCWNGWRDTEKSFLEVSWNSRGTCTRNTSARRRRPSWSTSRRTNLSRRSTYRESRP